MELVSIGRGKIAISGRAESGDRVVQDILIVFTSRTLAEILADGGCRSWALNIRRMRQLRYVICTRRRPASGSTEAVGQAFCVGRIAGFLPVPSPGGRARYLVRFQDYARVAAENFWRKGSGGPRYSDTGSVAARGIDPARLDFRPMPSRRGHSARMDIMLSEPR